MQIIKKEDRHKYPYFFKSQILVEVDNLAQGDSIFIKKDEWRYKTNPRQFFGNRIPGAVSTKKTSDKSGWIITKNP